MTETQIQSSPHKSRSGWRRVVKAFGYSWQGFIAALRYEHAFRQELALAVVLLPAALLIPVSETIRALLIFSMLLVLIVELINSSIEAVVDWISIEDHPLAGRAKDLGSAAVFVAIANLLIMWVVALATWLG